MTQEIETHNTTETRNNLWKRLSKNISDSKIGAFARAVSKAFGRLIVCKGGERKCKSADDNSYVFEEIYQSAPVEIVYPEDRYLSNGEILDRLEMLEDRFNKQTTIINTFKGRYTNREHAPTRLIEDATCKSTRLEKRFATIGSLVKQLKERRRKEESEERTMCVPLVDILQQYIVGNADGVREQYGS